MAARSPTLSVLSYVRGWLSLWLAQPVAVVGRAGGGRGWCVVLPRTVTSPGVSLLTLLIFFLPSAGYSDALLLQ